MVTIRRKAVSYTHLDVYKRQELLREAGILSNDEDSLYGASNLGVVHHLNAAMRANAIYQRDVDYICLLYTSRCV